MLQGILSYLLFFESDVNLSPHPVKKAGSIVGAIGDKGGIVTVFFTGIIIWKFVKDVSNIIQHERMKVE